MADARYKQMLVDATADDILLTTAFTGLQTNMLRPSIEAAGLDPDNPRNLTRSVVLTSTEVLQ
jgi:nitronate monooxygenase